MKFLLAMISMALSISADAVRGQEPPLPTKAETPTPSPQPNASPIPLPIEPPQLVPDTPAPKTAPPLSELDAAFKQSPVAAAAEEYRLHVEWRQLQNRVGQDPDVLTAKRTADTAKTDFEKRARLSEYYKIYYAHMEMLASAPDVKAYLEGKKNAVLATLAQSRVRPTPTPHSSPSH